ncbi:MAG: ABC transporter ATP-binding protein [Bacteroidota bacterium]|jgi:lipoprotein-releasing system ATP-binding protein
MIEGVGITKNYGSLQVLKSVNIHVNKGEVVSVVGSSGAGKSTLLQILGTLDKNYQGTLKIDGVEVSGLSDSRLSDFRNKKIGFIFQFHQLLPEFNAIENVCLPAWIGGADKKSTEQKAKEILDVLGVAHRFDHKPSALSGGEQQRVAVARALINRPAVVLADEPSGNLDSVNARELHQLFFMLREKYEQTFIIVTHNEELANLADRKLVMKDGTFI